MSVNDNILGYGNIAALAALATGNFEDYKFASGAAARIECLLGHGLVVRDSCRVLSVTTKGHCWLDAVCRLRLPVAKQHMIEWEMPS